MAIEDFRRSRLPRMFLDVNRPEYTLYNFPLLSTRKWRKNVCTGGLKSVIVVCGYRNSAQPCHHSQVYAWCPKAIIPLYGRIIRQIGIELDHTRYQRLTMTFFSIQKSFVHFSISVPDRGAEGGPSPPGIWGKMIFWPTGVKNRGTR